MYIKVELKNYPGVQQRTTYARSLMELSPAAYLHLLQTIQYLGSITRLVQASSFVFIREAVHFIFHQIHALLEQDHFWDPLEDLDWKDFDKIVVDNQKYGGLDFIRIDISWVEVIDVDDYQ